MKEIILPIVLLFCFSTKGQEIQFLLSDHNNSKLAGANMSIYEENDNYLESLHSDTNGLISINPKYFSPKYKLAVSYGICSTRDIHIPRNLINTRDTIIAYFNDTCLMLNTKVEKINLYIRENLQSRKLPYRIKSFKLDSVKIHCKLKKNVIQTISTFISSGSVLKIDFYYKNKNLILCSIKESNKYRKELFKAKKIYYQNNDIIFEYDYGRIDPGQQIYYVGSYVENNSNRGYNDSFTDDFLKMYVSVLMRKI